MADHAEQPGRGVPLVILAAVSVETGAAYAKRLFHRVGPAGAVLLRVGIAAVVLCLVTRPRLRGHRRADLFSVLLFGFALGGMNLAFYSALDRLPLGVTVTIEFVGPLAVAVAGSRRLLDLGWVACAATGVVLLSPVSGAGLDALGVVLALLAGVMWACYILLSARVGRAFPGVSGLALAMCVATVVMTVPGVVQGGSQLWSPAALGLGAVVAVMSSALPYSLELLALRLLRPSTFGVLMSLEMVTAAIAGWVVLGEHLGGREWVAVLLVLCANVGVVRSPLSRRPRAGTHRAWNRRPGPPRQRTTPAAPG